MQTVKIRGRMEGDDEVALVLRQSRHRNGVGGEPFVVSLFDKQGEESDRPQHMVAISFLTGSRGDFIDRTAVLDLTLLIDGVIDFGENSWRGSDLYGPMLADAWEKAELEKYPDLPVWGEED